MKSNISGEKIFTRSVSSIQGKRVAVVGAGETKVSPESSHSSGESEIRDSQKDRRKCAITIVAQVMKERGRNAA